MTLFGVDLSDFDRGRGPVDVAAMARDGIVFLTHKATEGTSVTHRYYAKTLNDARAAGIPFLGAYMVPRTPGNGGAGSIGAQVSYFLSYLDAQTPWWRTFDGFFLQVDTEHWGYDEVSPSVGAQACSLLRQQTGRWVIHYAPRWAYGDTIPGSEPLWASSYGANPAVPYRQAYPGDNASAWGPYSGRTPTFLQFGSKLTIGTQPGCDGDAFRGTVDQLRALITGGTMASTRTTNYGVSGLDGYSDGDLIAALLLNYDPEAAAGRPGINGVQMTFGSLVKQVQALVTVVGQVLTGQGVEKGQVDQLLTAVKQIGAPTDAQIAAMAGAVADKLIASNANGLTAADHAGVVDDVKKALAAAAQAQATALTAS